MIAVARDRCRHAPSALSNVGTTPPILMCAISIRSAQNSIAGENMTHRWKHLRVSTKHRLINHTINESIDHNHSHSQLPETFYSTQNNMSQTNYNSRTPNLTNDSPRRSQNDSCAENHTNLFESPGGGGCAANFRWSSRL